MAKPRRKLVCKWSFRSAAELRAEAELVGIAIGEVVAAMTPEERTQLRDFLVALGRLQPA